MENKKFLVTENLESVAILKKMGFQLIDETDGRYTFLNNKNIVFQKSFQKLYFCQKPKVLEQYLKSFYLIQNLYFFRRRYYHLRIVERINVVQKDNNLYQRRIYKISERF